MNLKVGDKVRVKSKEEIKKLQDENGHVNDCYFSQNMFEFCEKEFLINKKADEWFSFTDVCDWAFTEDMLELVDEGIKKDIDNSSLRMDLENFEQELKKSQNDNIEYEKIINGLCNTIDTKNSRQGVLNREKHELRSSNCRLNYENATYKKEYATIVEKDNMQVKVLDGLCDTIDAKDAEFKKAVREGIIKLELRDKLLNIFNVVVKD